MKKDSRTLRYRALFRKRKKQRKAGDMSGWVGQRLTFTPQNSDVTYFHNRTHGMEYGKKYLVTRYTIYLCDDFQIQAPDDSLVFISYKHFKEFQKPAT